MLFGILPNAFFELASPVCVPGLPVCFFIGVSCVLLPSRCLSVNTPAFSSCTCLPCRSIFWARSIARKQDLL